ncbi:hypothetical protein, partial [Micromonospora sp. NPDC048830]|uniref:hypothetical protein n=1 Tax=Micromonospora sp. NPDC048830 TaxID=3364257 RepID=UPI00371645B3
MLTASGGEVLLVRPAHAGFLTVLDDVRGPYRLHQIRSEQLHRSVREQHGPHRLVRVWPQLAGYLVYLVCGRHQPPGAQLGAQPFTEGGGLSR